MEKKEEKTGLAFIDRVHEVAKELQALQQSAPAENKAAFMLISTQHLGARDMRISISFYGDTDNLVHAVKTALEVKDVKKMFLAAILAEVIAGSDENNEEGSDE